MSEFIVKEANRLLFPESEKCVELSLEKTINASEHRLNDKVLSYTYFPENESKSKYYSLTIKVNPSKALLESIIIMLQFIKYFHFTGIKVEFQTEIN